MVGYTFLSLQEKDNDKITTTDFVAILLQFSILQRKYSVAKRSSLTKICNRIFGHKNICHQFVTACYVIQIRKVTTKFWPFVAKFRAKIATNISVAIWLQIHHKYDFFGLPDSAVNYYFYINFNVNIIIGKTTPKFL